MVRWLWLCLLGLLVTEALWQMYMWEGMCGKGCEHFSGWALTSAIRLSREPGASQASLSPMDCDWALRLSALLLHYSLTSLMALLPPGSSAHALCIPVSPWWEWLVLSPPHTFFLQSRRGLALDSPSSLRSLSTLGFPCAAASCGNKLWLRF